MTQPIRYMTVCFFLGVNIFIGNQLVGQNEIAVVKEVNQRSVLTYVKSLHDDQRFEYLSKLGSENKIELLKIVAKSDLRGAAYAASIAGSTMRTVDLLIYCKSFPVNSDQWLVLFNSLGMRNKMLVIPYIVQIARHRNAAARCRSYELCQRAGWPDLTMYAVADCYSTIPFYRVNNFIKETVGDIAQKYLQSISHPASMSGGYIPKK